ncbi:MAG TPA: flagellar hook-associated protein FlgL [Clostridiales bacterium]|nr:flagellar hook-associated protein FlgL [Clostridiales bacterium]
MRITNHSVVRNYNKTLDYNRNLLNKYSNQIISGRKFNTMSEDTASGVRAMQVRRNLSRIEAYLDNAKAAKSQLTSAETTLMQISNLTKSVSEKYIQAINGTNGPQERDIMATELEKLQEELLTLSNARFSDRYLFGGTNTVSAPFTTDNQGNLYYNGVDVRELYAGHPLMEDSAYMDVGLGILFTDPDDPTQVNPNTAYQHTMVGAQFLGTGPDNLYLVLGEMISSLRSETFDPDKAGSILDRFQAASNNVNVAMTKLGSDSQYLEFTINRLEDEKLNLYERQTQLEAADPEEAIMNFKMQEYVYNAALQMGQRLLQPTLFNFID